MANLTKQDVLDLAKLAKLELTAEEVASFNKELVEILNFVQTLDEVDTNNLEPTNQVTGLVNVMRKDEIKDYGIDRKDIMANVPKTKDNYIKVKKVL